MPRYYFELADGGRESDDRGTELPDLDAARLAAIVFAGEYISDHPEVVVDRRSLRVLVTDEAGVERLAVAITVASAGSPQSGGDGGAQTSIHRPE
jgi:hypothetical protein